MYYGSEAGVEHQQCLCVSEIFRFSPGPQETDLRYEQCAGVVVLSQGVDRVYWGFSKRYMQCGSTTATTPSNRRFSSSPKIRSVALTRDFCCGICENCCEVPSPHAEIEMKGNLLVFLRASTMPSEPGMSNHKLVRELEHEGLYIYTGTDPNYNSAVTRCK